jgi:aminobenzoyl-glutamate utilization protein B
MSIGQKGMIIAAKALAATGADLFSDRQLVSDAKAVFRHQMEGKTYQSVIPADQKPPLNCRTK